jgi:acyl-coenzyme A thioesterase PaaI-like protein
VADWTPDPFHHAFEGILNGGIIALVLDCHSNWTAVYHIMKENTGDAIPGTVTSDFCIRFIHPTPMGRTIRLRAKVVEVKKDRASVKASLEVENRATALFQGTFVAVKEGHPAFSRWR